MTVIDSGERKARKPYACRWCNKPIPIGAVYAFTVWVDGRDITTEHAHPPCEGLALRYGHHHALDDYDWNLDWSEVLRWRDEENDETR